MVLWPFVLFRYPARGHFQSPSERLIRHEFEHCYQVKQSGILKFYARYIWLAITKGYRNHPDEVAARAVERTPLTEQEKEWYTNKKVEL